MKEKLEVFDDFLLDAFEKFAHKVQRAFGVNCFRLAKQSFILAIAMLLLYLIVGLFAVGFNPFFVFISIVLLLFVGTTMMQSAKLAFLLSSIYEEGMYAPFANRLRIEMKHLRIKQVFFSIAFCFGLIMLGDMRVFILLTVMQLAEICGNYFLACTPLPPCKGEVKEWLESFGKKFEPATAKLG